MSIRWIVDGLQLVDESLIDNLMVWWSDGPLPGEIDDTNMAAISRHQIWTCRDRGWWMSELNITQLLVIFNTYLFWWCPKSPTIGTFTDPCGVAFVAHQGFADVRRVLLVMSWGFNQSQLISLAKLRGCSKTNQNKMLLNNLQFSQPKRKPWNIDFDVYI